MSRLQGLKRLMLIAAAPVLLTGFTVPADGISPTPVCDVGCGSSDRAEDSSLTQHIMAETNTSMVLALGIPTWRNLEPCTKDPTGALTCYDNSSDTTGYACTCTYNLSVLDAYLTSYLGVTKSNEALIQLAPIFTAARSVPPYLAKTPFQDPTMIAAFDGLWDQVAVLLAQPKYNNTEFIISIGNEINNYLDAPNGCTANGCNDSTDPRGGPIPNETDPAQAWQSFGNFYAAVAPYVKTYPAAGQNVTRLVGVTETWLGGCGSGESIYLQSLCSSPTLAFPTVPEIKSFLGISDVYVFTYYPGFAATDTPSTVDTTVKTAIQKMAYLSTNDGKPIVLQEAGTPSNLNDPGGPLGPPDKLTEQQQSYFVQSMFADVKAENAKPGGPYFQGLNIFQLRDFNKHVVAQGLDCTPTNPSHDTCPLGTTCVASPGDQGTWTEDFPAVSPDPRQDSDMVYDAARSRFVLFGGVQVPPNMPNAAGFSDVWALYDPSSPTLPAAPSWEQVTTSGTPPSGNGSDSVFVPGQAGAPDRLITVAQNSSTDKVEFYALTFNADGSGNWAMLQPDTSGVPDASFLGYRPFGRAIYDSDDDSVLYLGGRLSSNLSTAQLLILDLGNNKLLGYDLAPAGLEPREEFGFAYDKAAHRALVYGGAQTTATGGTALSDMWQISLATNPPVATQIFPTNGNPADGAPTPRTFFTWANDASRGRAIMFGGASTTFLNDVWALDYKSNPPVWNKLQPSANPGPGPIGRYGASGTFAANTGKMLIFGGTSDFQYAPLQETWQLAWDFRSVCQLSPNPVCSADSDCPAPWHCCLDPAVCPNSVLDRCELGSNCDLADSLDPSVSSCGANGACPTGRICDTLNRCVVPSLRTWFCSWGLIADDGTPKPAWTTFLASAAAFP